MSTEISKTVLRESLIGLGFIEEKFVVWCGWPREDYELLMKVGSAKVHGSMFTLGRIIVIVGKWFNWHGGEGDYLRVRLRHTEVDCVYEDKLYEVSHSRRYLGFALEAAKDCMADVAIEGTNNEIP